MKKFYFTATKNWQTEYLAKDSRFIAHILPANSPLKALQQIKEIGTRHKSATHNCWAYRIGAGDECLFRSDDNGEPAGTAGKPILQALETRSVSDAVLIVTRYFGGTKLGIGGLIRAYGGASFAVLDKADLVKVSPKAILTIEFQYNLTNSVRKSIVQSGAKITETHYSDNVKMQLSIELQKRAALFSTLTENTQGKIKIQT